MPAPRFKGLSLTPQLLRYGVSLLTLAGAFWGVASWATSISYRVTTIETDRKARIEAADKTNDKVTATLDNINTNVNQLRVDMSGLVGELRARGLATGNYDGK